MSLYICKRMEWASGMMPGACTENVQCKTCVSRLNTPGKCMHTISGFEPNQASGTYKYHSSEPRATSQEVLSVSVADGRRLSVTGVRHSFEKCVTKMTYIVYIDECVTPNIQI